MDVGHTNFYQDNEVNVIMSLDYQQRWALHHFFDQLKKYLSSGIRKYDLYPTPAIAVRDVGNIKCILTSHNFL